MKTIDDILQDIMEDKKLFVPFHIALQIIGTVERIELKEKNNGRFQTSVFDYDEE